MSDLRAWFEDPLLRSMLVDMFLAGVAAAVVCSVLSVLVVLKRLSFVGQGVSHSAFGGLGFAAILGVVGGLVGGATEGAIGGGAMGSGWGWGSIGGVVVVSLFCMAAAVVMGLVSDRRTMTLDASIGAILAATMAAGFIMLDLARRGVVLGGGQGGGGGGGGGGAVPSAESWGFGGGRRPGGRGGGGGGGGGGRGGGGRGRPPPPPPGAVGGVVVVWADRGCWRRRCGAGVGDGGFDSRCAVVVPSSGVFLGV